jgi:phosphatidylglycerol:prolipoprotein diacylglycerol transferase
LEGPLGLSFPPYSPASSAQARDGLLSAAHQHSLSVHPTQLYEAWGSLALAAALFFWLHARKRYDGHVFVVFLGGYATLRFILEIFRADDRGGIAFLSTSQWVGVLLFVVAFLLHKKLKPPVRPQAIAE